MGSFWNQRTFFLFPHKQTANNLQMQKIHNRPTLWAYISPAWYKNHPSLLEAVQSQLTPDNGLTSSSSDVKAFIKPVGAMKRPHTTRPGGQTTTTSKECRS